MKHTKHLRLFAGPNGSGKSSIYRLIAEHYRLGVHVCADELRSQLETGAGVTLSLFLPSLNGEDLETFFNGHTLHAQVEAPFPFVVGQGGCLTLAEGCDRSPKLAHAAAILADYVRTRLVEAGEDLSVETALSCPSDVSLLRQAKAAGYGIYLYYVCVASPEISKQRVILNQTQGGFAVPETEVVARYERSLALLKDAVALSDRTCLFDNTYSGASLKLEINQAKEVIAHEPVLPDWITRSLPALVAK